MKIVTVVLVMEDEQVREGERVVGLTCADGLFWTVRAGVVSHVEQAEDVLARL
jgi:hypothetical protein